MSKFNSRVIWDLPAVESLENFKDSVLTLLTSYQQAIIRILRVVREELETNPSFRNMILVVLAITIIATILERMGRRKHGFYVKENPGVAEINKCTKLVKVEMDAMRKHILKYMEMEEVSGKGEGRVKEEAGVQNSQDLELKFKKISSVLESYQQCIKSNTQFNFYFLDEFVKVYAELNVLRKSRGVRSSSKAKNGEVKTVVAPEKPKEIREPVPIPSNPPITAPISTPIVNPVVAPVVTPTVAPVRNGPRIPSAPKATIPKAPANRPPQPAKEPIKQPIVFELTQETSKQQTKQESPINVESQTKQDKISNQFNNPSASDSLFSFDPFGNPSSDSTFEPHFGTQPVSQPQVPNQPNFQPITPTDPLQQQPQSQSQQIPDDPILLAPKLPAVKHTLPTMQTKPKREVPSIGGRKPPPPPPRK